jgi:hypothetical protein
MFELRTIVGPKNCLIYIKENSSTKIPCLYCQRALQQSILNATLTLHKSTCKELHTCVCLFVVTVYAWENLQYNHMTVRHDGSLHVYTSMTFSDLLPWFVG